LRCDDFDGLTQVFIMQLVGGGGGGDLLGVYVGDSLHSDGASAELRGVLLLEGAPE
jgi:hypothetical protein